MTFLEKLGSNPKSKKLNNTVYQAIRDSLKAIIRNNLLTRPTERIQKPFQDANLNLELVTDFSVLIDELEDDYLPRHLGTLRTIATYANVGGYLWTNSNRTFILYCDAVLSTVVDLQLANTQEAKDLSIHTKPVIVECKRIYHGLSTLYNQL